MNSRERHGQFLIVLSGPAGSGNTSLASRNISSTRAATFGRLVGQLYAMTGDRAEAQDAVQEAFVRAWAHHGRIDRDLGPRPGTGSPPGGSHSPGGGCQGAFTIISGMLTSGFMRPHITANFYHALADIPGVKVEMNVVDLAGRSGIAFAYPLGHRTTQEIILNKRTYTYMGSYFGTNVPASKADGQALLRQALVPGPGIRP